MNWELFWSAFGAIGTTLGSLITASAVIVAMKQYKQPLNKVIEVGFTSAMPLFLGQSIHLYCVSIKNKGLREVYIDSINMKGKGCNLWLNNAQYKLCDIVTFPVVNPEECLTIYFESKYIKSEIKRAVDAGILRENQKTLFFATDSFGENYQCKVRIKVKNLIRDFEKTVQYKN